MLAQTRLVRNESILIRYKISLYRSCQVMEGSSAFYPCDKQRVLICDI
jgi:hypothetical protein